MGKGRSGGWVGIRGQGLFSLITDAANLQIILTEALALQTGTGALHFKQGTLLKGKYMIFDQIKFQTF